MTRVRKYGPLSNRAFRAVAAVRSAIAILQLWRAMRWHDKMWLLWALETLPRERRAAFLYRDNKPDLVFHLEAAGKIAGTHYED
jgi:hypothetical protein